ncbi:hypothetical protein BKA70DRAFT_1215187 [Coprinopsis sp. MPI-PUGE-AT-0042]|nr:hypothetical protein BKA70DRAFT_1215187 [Coprinopsis sp. MPI-PUGE-AT-0042]
MFFALCRLPFKYREAYSPSSPFARHKSSKATIQYFSDASGDGIGFVCNGKWLAWRFMQNCVDLPRASKTGIIKTTYSELLGVKLGLVSIIQSGLAATNVTNFCDNLCVVEIINSLQSGPKLSEKEKGTIGGLVEIIQEIRKGARINLNADWVAHKENLADGPSRGKSLVDELRFLPRAPVPRYLQRVIIAL